MTNAAVLALRTLMLMFSSDADRMFRSVKQKASKVQEDHAWKRLEERFGNFPQLRVFLAHKRELSGFGFR